MNIVKIDELKQEIIDIEKRLFAIDSQVAEIATSVKSAMETKKLISSIIERFEVLKNDLDLYRKGEEIDVINPQEMIMKIFKQKYDKGNDGFGGLPKFPS